MNEYDKIEERAIKKLKPEKPRMKISGKSAFLLDKLSKKPSEKESVGSANKDGDEKKFQRKVEDFKCEFCGYEVAGDGYTDHCPNCLWGRHVDVNPGDRAAKCGGAMKPVDFEEKGGVVRIKYECQKCDHIFWVKSAKNDDFEKIINIGVHENL